MAIIAKIKGIPVTKKVINVQKEKGAENVFCKQVLILLQQESQLPQHSLQTPSQHLPQESQHLLQELQQLLQQLQQLVQQFTIPLHI